MNPTKKCMNEVILNNNEVKKAEHGQCQRYPSETRLAQVSTDLEGKEMRKG